MFKDRKFLLLFFVYALFCTTFAYLYISSEDKMYPANIVIPNFMYIEFFDSIFIDKVNIFSSLREYLMNQAYNPLPVLLLFPFYLIFGAGSRLGYVLGIELFYILPLIFIILYFIYKKLVSYNEKNTLLNIYILTSLFFNTTLYFSALRGYSDIIIFIPYFILLLFFIDFKFEEKQNFFKIALFSVILYSIFVMRRCYIVLDFSLIVTFLIFSFVRIFSNFKSFTKNEILKKLSYLTINLLFIPGIIFCSLMFILQKNYILYSLSLKLEVFNAYQGTSLLYNLNDFVMMFGYFAFIVFILLFVPSLFVKDSKKSNFLFLISTVVFYVLPFLTYTIINNFGFFFVLSMQLVLIYTLDKITILTSSFNKKIIANFMIFIMLIFNIFNFITFVSFSPNDETKKFASFLHELKNKNIFANAVEGIPSHPYKYNYYQAFDSFYETLFSEIKNNPNANVTIYAFLDDVVSYYVLKNYSLFNDRILYKNLLPTAEYFNYEGIPPRNLDADYVIVSNPVRQIFIEEDFLPLYFASNAFFENKNISQSYECIFSAKEKYLREDMSEFFELRIYKKVRPVTPSQAEDFFNSIVQEQNSLQDLYSRFISEYAFYFSEKYGKH